MNKVNERNLVDALDRVTKALPAANANNDTDSIGIKGKGPHRERLKLRVDVPATTALVEDKVITFSLQDSADDSSFAATSPAQSFVITGGTGNGSSQTTFYFDLNNQIRDFIRVNQAVENGGGNNTAITVAYSLVS